MPNGLIAEDSLRVHPDGLALSLTLPWYRSLWLSSVGTLKVTIDGTEVSAGDIAFELQGVRYTLDQLPEQSDVLWYLQEHPLLIVRREAPIALGETHQVEIFGELRLPYMQIAPGQDGGPGMYVPNFVRQSLELTSTDRDAAAPALVSDVPPPPPATDADPFKLGLTLYSASAEFRAGWFDFDGLLDRVAELGIGPASRSSPRRCCRRTRSSRTSSSRAGAPRSTSTASTRARSGRTSTWVAAVTAT